MTQSSSTLSYHQIIRILPLEDMRSFRGLNSVSFVCPMKLLVGTHKPARAVPQNDWFTKRLTRVDIDFELFYSWEYMPGM